MPILAAIDREEKLEYRDHEKTSHRLNLSKSASKYNSIFWPNINSDLTSKIVDKGSHELRHDYTPQLHVHGDIDCFLFNTNNN